MRKAHKQDVLPLAERRFRDAVQAIVHTQASPSDGDVLAELGRIVGLEDAISLSDLLAAGKKRGKVAGPGTTDAVTAQSVDAITTLVLQGRLQGLDIISARFDGDHALIPGLKEPLMDDGLSPAQRLQRLYTGTQQELAVYLQTLRGQIQQGLAGLSPSLARLATLDDGIGQLIAAQLMSALAAMPRILGDFCQRCMASSPEHWEAEVATATRTLLVAELDLRLQPLLGLAEAVEEMTGVHRC